MRGLSTAQIRRAPEIAVPFRERATQKSFSILITGFDTTDGTVGEKWNAVSTELILGSPPDSPLFHKTIPNKVASSILSSIKAQWFTQYLQPCRRGWGNSSFSSWPSFL